MVWVLGAIGVTAISFSTWRRLAASQQTAGSIALTVGVAVLVVGAVVGLVWWGGRRAAQGGQHVAQDNPGVRVHQVWADATLSGQLQRLGIWEERMNPAGGTRLALAWSPQGVELWRGAKAPRTVISLAWDQVASVTVGVGNAASTNRPAVVLSTTMAADLVLVPTKKPAGSLLPATRAGVDALVADLRTARDAAPTT